MLTLLYMYTNLICLFLLAWHGINKSIKLCLLLIRRITVCNKQRITISTIGVGALSAAVAHCAPETAQHPVQISEIYATRMRRGDTVGETLWFLIRRCSDVVGRWPSLLVSLFSSIQSHPCLCDRIPSRPLSYPPLCWTFPSVPLEYPTINPPATSSVVSTSFLTSSVLLARRGLLPVS